MGQRTYSNDLRSRVVADVALATENLIRGGAHLMSGCSRTGMMDFLGIVGALLASLLTSRASRDAEVLFLRQQLLVLKRSIPGRIRLRRTDRLICVWLHRLFPSLLEAAVISKPETLARWQRSGFRLFQLWEDGPRPAAARA